MFSLAIIIPCYNEALRFQKDVFEIHCSQNPALLFVFVNDGSRDKTKNILEDVRNTCPENVLVIDIQNNLGKGNAVRKGILHVLNNYSSNYVGYLDADLSIPFAEITRIHAIAVQEKADIALGSKIKKIDTKIERSVFRHIISRIIATIVDARFKLGCYDTQCGAKVLRSAVIENIISKPFYTRWFFDVELMLRLRKENPKFKALEIPLNECNTIQNSKLNFFSSTSILKELNILFSKY